MPSATATRVGVISICADLRPSREAVTVMGPGAGSVVRTSLERTATRLMPHSVLRYVLLVDSSLPLL